MLNVWLHDGNKYEEPHHIKKEHWQQYIKYWQEVLYPVAVKANKDHYIYASNIYDKNGELIELNIYMIPVNNGDFEKKIKYYDELAAAKECTANYSVFHKGSHY